MSNAPIQFEVEIENLDLLRDALYNAPETVTRALEEAGQDAIDVLSASVDETTHEISGDLRRANDFRMDGSFSIVYSNFMSYASFEEARHGTTAEGIAAVQGEVEQVYEDAMDDVAQQFGSGR